MSDITLCTARGCPLAGKCRRKEESADPWQSYAAFQWWLDERGKAHCPNWVEPRRKKSPRPVPITGQSGGTHRHGPAHTEGEEGG